MHAVPIRAVGWCLWLPVVPSVRSRDSRRGSFMEIEARCAATHWGLFGLMLRAVVVVAVKAVVIVIVVVVVVVGGSGGWW